MTPIDAVVIDDSEADRYLARRFLEGTGRVNRVIELDNADKALEVLADCFEAEQQGPEGGRPLLVLVDIRMPGMSGVELVELLEEFLESRGRDVPNVVVYMLTSSSRDEDRQRVAGIKFVGGSYEKPVDSEMLAEIFARHFDD